MLRWLLALLIPALAFLVLIDIDAAVLSRSLEETVLAGGRWVALGLSAWLVGTQLLYTLAVVTRTDWLTRVLLPITLPVTRRISAGVASIVISLSSASATAQTTPVPTPVTVQEQAPQGLRQEATPTPVLKPIAGEEQPCITLAPEGSYISPLVWRVRPGDHLWSIAGEHLGIVLDRRPTGDEHTRYWFKVIETARPMIRSGDPDLIYPDEEIPLPPLLDAGISR